MPDQLVLDRAAKPIASANVASGVKTILVHIQNDKSLQARVETALSLARACAAHLSCVHITPIEAYVAFDSFGGVFVMNDVIKAIDDEAAQIGEKLQEKLRSEDVSWDYAEVTGNVPSQLICRAALADLVVTGRDPHRTDFAGPTIGMLGELLHRSRTPLFIPADDGVPPDVTGPAVIAWDGSYEAANAVRASIGLLKLSSDVRILQLEEKSDEAFPGTKLLEYLSRHSIHADLIVEKAATSGAARECIPSTLLAHAKALKASYLLMGGYNHSRVGEYIFGGVTRALLGASPVPLVVAH